MKELSIEEKAKAYDEIIEKANKMHHENCEACKMCIEELIPELKESEDERIKSVFRELAENYLFWEKSGLTKEKALAWLEKQCEQKIDDDDKAILENWEGIVKDNKEKWQLSDWFVKATLLLVQKIEQIGLPKSIVDNNKTMLNACINTLRNVGHSHLAVWLEKQGEQTSLNNIWHRANETPQIKSDDRSVAVLLCCYRIFDVKPVESWEVAHYYPEYGFLNLGQTIKENDVIRWAYLDELIEKQDKQKPVAKYKVGDTIYYNSFGRLVSFVIANIVEDGTDNPMYEDKDGNSIFQNDIVERKPVFEMITPEESLGIDSDTYNKIVDECIYGEQKPGDKVEPKFHKGDWVVISYGKINQIIDVDEDSDGFILDDGTYFSGSWCDMYHLWTIQDAKNGDILAFDDNIILMFKDLYNKSTFHSYCYIADEVFHISKGDWWESKGFKPATKEQCDKLEKAITEAGYKKELKLEKRKL